MQNRVWVYLNQDFEVIEKKQKLFVFENLYCFYLVALREKLSLSKKSVFDLNDILWRRNVK